MFAGLIIAIRIFLDGTHITGWDFLKLLGLYVLLNLIRFGIIFAIKWPLNKIGYGLDWKNGVVLGYSGLRGAVSLILSLVVFLDKEGVSKKVREIVFFQTAGIAILTLIINGTTIGCVVRGLGMMRVSTVKKKMLKNLMKAYRREVHEVIEEIKEEKNFGKIDWDRLKDVACTEKIRNDIFKRKNIKADEDDLRASSAFNENELMTVDNKEYTKDELYQEAKYRYLTTLKGLYWDHFHNAQ